jgi:hypothetical protein
MDNKAIAAAIAFVGLASLVAFGAFTLMSRSTGETAQAVSNARAEAAIDFPAQKSMRAPLPAARAQAARVTATQPMQQRSGLGFIKKEGGFSGGGTGPSRLSGDASAAAARGDAASLLKGLHDDPGEVPDVDAKAGMGNKAIRATMQKVVDTVKAQQPNWYKQYLANKYLKRIADRYDQTNDFKGFLKDIGKSRSFERMLKSKYKTKSMKRLTKGLLRSRETGPHLKQIMLNEADNPDVQHLMARYGSAAGFPPDLVRGAQAAMKLLGGSRKKRGNRKRSANRKRPTLQKRGFNAPQGGNNSGRAPQKMPAGVDPGQLPPGVDPQELLKQFKGK